MQYNKLPPYLTSIEIVRSIATAFDTKSSKKKLDDNALEKNADYRLLDKLIIEAIYGPLQKKFSSEIVGIVSESINCVFRLI